MRRFFPGQVKDRRSEHTNDHVIRAPNSQRAARPPERATFSAYSRRVLLFAGFALAACHAREPDPSPPPTPALPSMASTGTSLASLRTDERAPKPGSRLALSDQCSKICARSAPLACVGGSECQSFCEELGTSLACHEQMTSVLTCFAEQGTERWECAEQGLPALKEGYCSGEQAAYRNCRAKDE